MIKNNITSQLHYELHYKVLERLTSNRNWTQTHSKKMGPPFPTQTFLAGAVPSKRLTNINLQHVIIGQVRLIKRQNK